MNPNGFFYYSVYSVGGSVDPYLGTGAILTNDLVFALHAFCLSSVQFVQVFMYDRGAQKPINKLVIGFLIFLFCCSIGTFIYEATGHPI